MNDRTSCSGRAGRPERAKLRRNASQLNPRDEPPRAFTLSVSLEVLPSRPVPSRPVALRSSGGRRQRRDGSVQIDTDALSFRFHRRAERTERPSCVRSPAFPNRENAAELPLGFGTSLNAQFIHAERGDPPVRSRPHLDTTFPTFISLSVPCCCARLTLSSHFHQVVYAVHERDNMVSMWGVVIPLADINGIVSSRAVAPCGCTL